ncbi:GDSL-type esterase/lipase family protein [Labilibaculum sp.]|uniref:GDSL-type esterase/lipase family protein n=1 Tax=Labilibaculum sp. TaxID=2060723 RepID=UPI0035685675
MKSRIAFLGDSLTYEGDWQEYFPAYEVGNFGVSGETSAEIISRLDEVLAWKPTKIFLMMGINDLANGISNKTILENFRTAIHRCKETSHSQLVVQTILPTNENIFKSDSVRGVNILELNYRLKELCQEEKVVLLDLYPSFSNYAYQLIRDYTPDGLHLKEAGYSIWQNCLQAENLI